VLSSDYKGEVYDKLITTNDLVVKPIKGSFFGTDYGIYYKDILLFTSMDARLNNYKVKIIDETNCKVGFVTIKLTDSQGDSFHYGKWRNLENLKKWLKNPSQMNK
jgi:hypothetical protein